MEDDGYDPIDLSPGGAFEEGGTIVVLFGRSKSGKSHMARFLVWRWVTQLKLFDHVYAFNGGPSRVLETYLSPRRIATLTFDGFVRLMACTKKLFQEKKQRTLLILEDIGGHRDIFNRKELSSFWTTYRHYGITILVCGHNYTQMPPALRDQVEIWGLMHQPYSKEIRQTFCKLGVGNGEEEKFMGLLDELTSPDMKHVCLVSDKQRSEFHFIKAPATLPPFIIG